MVPEPELIDDEELRRIEERVDNTTPGPWFVRELDDAAAMSMVAISTVPDTGAGERWPNFQAEEIIALTLVQEPRYANTADERWDENASFIAHARQDVPRLIAEIKRLRSLIASSNGPDSANRVPEV